MHWVQGARGERYSLIFYSTDARDAAPRLAEPFDAAWRPPGASGSDSEDDASDAGE